MDAQDHRLDETSKFVAPVGRPRSNTGEGISHEQVSSRNYLMGGNARRKPRGAV